MDYEKRVENEQEYYRRIKLLGEGAYGKAFLAEFIRDKSLWVIKQVNMAELSSAQRQETKKQAIILSKMAHPYIIKFKEVYVTRSDKLVLVMEYAQGGDLAKRIIEQKSRSRFFQEELVLDWFTQICLAIKHVHDRKIIHRDIKGQNIFLTSNNHCKLGDFGIARALTSTLEKVKTVIGTPYYLSPQIIESKPYSFASDIWSMGVLLYEMCMLKPPFVGQSLQFLALKIVQGQYEPLHPSFSMSMRNLVNAMLQLDPARRPSINQIVHLPIIEERIKSLLTHSQRDYEFSHTILHNRNILSSKLAEAKDKERININTPPKIDERQKPVKESPDLRKQPSHQQPQHQPQKNYHYNQPNPNPSPRPITPKPVKQELPMNKVNLKVPTSAAGNRRPEKEREPPKKAFEKKEVRPLPLPAVSVGGGAGLGSAMMNPAFQKKQQEKKKQALIKKKVTKDASKEMKEQRKVSVQKKKVADEKFERDQERKESVLKREAERRLMRQDIDKKRKQAGKWSHVPNERLRNSDAEVTDKKGPSPMQHSVSQPKILPSELVNVKHEEQQEQQKTDAYSCDGAPRSIQSENAQIRLFLDSLQKECLDEPPVKQKPSKKQQPPRFTHEQTLFNYSLSIRSPPVAKPKVAPYLEQQQRNEQEMLQVIKQLQDIVSQTQDRVKEAVKDSVYSDEMFDTISQLEVREEDPEQPSLQDRIRKNLIEIRGADQASIECLSDNCKLELLRERLERDLTIDLFMVSYRKIGGLPKLEEIGTKKVVEEIGRGISQQAISLLFTLIILEGLQNMKNM